MEIVPFETADVPQLASLQPTGWRDIAPVFEWYVSTGFCTPVKAVERSETVGVGCAIAFEGTGWLAHIIVHHDYRRRGIGSWIVGELTEHLEKQGVTGISLVSTDDGYEVYRRFGFVDEGEYAFFRSEKPVSSHQGELAVEIAQSRDHQEILELDRAASGEEREPLLRPHLSGALVFRERGRILGAYFPELGEGLVEGVSPEAGLSLLDYRLVGGERCVVPAANKDAVQYLKEKGYSESGRSYRMYRGDRIPWRPSYEYSRIAGNLG